MWPSHPSHPFSPALPVSQASFPCLVPLFGDTGGCPRSRLAGSPKSPAEAAAKKLPSPQSSLLARLRPYHEEHGPRMDSFLVVALTAPATPPLLHVSSQLCSLACFWAQLGSPIIHIPHPAHCSGPFACMFLCVAGGTSLTTQHPIAPGTVLLCQPIITFHTVAATEAPEEGDGSGSCRGQVLELDFAPVGSALRAEEAWSSLEAGAATLLPSPHRAQIRGHSRCS